MSSHASKRDDDAHGHSYDQNRDRYHKDRSRHHRRSRSRSVDYDRRRRHRRRSYSRSPTRSRSREHNNTSNNNNINSSGGSNRRDRRETGSRRHRDSRSRSRSHSKRGDRSSRRHEERRERDSKNEERHSQSERTSLQDLPLPAKEPKGAYYNLSTEDPIDKERIHREIEEKLRETLAREGKVYPPKKPEASHPVFANDGSFLELFKKMQEAQQPAATVAVAPALPIVSAISASAVASVPYVTAAAMGKTAPPPLMVGRRRGGKILKTGVVAKPKATPDGNSDPKDFWSLYLAEVNKYKNTACETDGGNRPLVK